MYIARDVFRAVLVVALAVLAGCSSTEHNTDSTARQTNAPAATARIEGYIDRPSEGEKVLSNMVAGGWVFSTGAPIQEVSVLIDGQSVSVATHGGNRPDVAKAFPGVSAAVNSGWHTEVPGSAIAAGDHQVTVRVRLTDGTERMLGPVAVSK